MFQYINPSSPKRTQVESRASSNIFPYYAGFSSSFVDSVLSTAFLPENPIVFDPWNGCGTTTTICSRRGLHSIGFDLNPAMSIVSKSKLLSGNEKPSLAPITHEIISKTKSNNEHLSVSIDPLRSWIMPRSANYIRQLEFSIQSLLIDEKKYELLCDRNNYASTSSLAAFYYVCLFRTARRIFSHYLSSNPTWFKQPKSKQSRLCPDKEYIISTFTDEFNRMTMNATDMAHANGHSVATIDVASSLNIPLPNNSVDIVLSSPPYCTRIDYAVATLPELCVLGYSNTTYSKIRRELIGSPTIDASCSLEKTNLSKTCIDFLDKVEEHTSKASKSYYLKNHIQYFQSIQKSIEEISRVLKQHGGCVLVVQDSYYKNIHNDLPAIISEMASNKNLHLTNRFDFKSKRSMSSVNTSSKKHRPHTCPTESILCFVHTHQDIPPWQTNQRINN